MSDSRTGVPRHFGVRLRWQRKQQPVRARPVEFGEVRDDAVGEPMSVPVRNAKSSLWRDVRKVLKVRGLRVDG
jgi:hypothetical protein